MPSSIRSAAADATGAATVRFDSSVPAGLVWVISQIATQVRPTRVGAAATVNYNGFYLTSTANATASSAQGPPWIRLGAGDLLEVVFSGCTVGDNCIVNLLYNETQWTSESLGIAVV